MGGLVSVIVPTFNRAYCLRRTLDSVLRQTYSRLEIVLVDDGSTDGTQTLIETAYGHDPRIRYVHQENRGVSAARNQGLRLAQGDYLALLDSDDVWKPWKLELQVRCLELLPQAGMIWTDMEAIDPDGKVCDPAHLRTMYSAWEWFTTETLFTEAHPVRTVWPDAPESLRGTTVYSGEIYSQMIMGSLVHTSTVVLRRSRFEKVGYFDESLRCGEDYGYHLRTCREGPVAFVQVASIQYQKGRPDQLANHENSLHIAEAFLETIAPRIEHDRARIHLPQWMIRRVLSEAHAWVGGAALDNGNNREARWHLARSVLILPWHGRRAGLLLVALLPSSVSVALRRAYGAAKARFGRP
jgi:GT2 family glycosyltransferase